MTALVKVKLWIAQTFARGSEPDIETVINWIQGGHVPGEILNGQYYVDVEAFQAQPSVLPPDVAAARALNVPALASSKFSAESYVYLLAAVGAQRVKIGTTTHLMKRVAELATASPFPLRLVGAILGDEALESALHRRFGKHRVHGEWFHEHTSILEYFADAELQLRRQE